MALLFLLFAVAFGVAPIIRSTNPVDRDGLRQYIVRFSESCPHFNRNITRLRRWLNKDCSAVDADKVSDLWSIGDFTGFPAWLSLEGVTELSQHNYVLQITEATKMILREPKTNATNVFAKTNVGVSSAKTNVGVSSAKTNVGISSAPGAAFTTRKDWGTERIQQATWDLSTIPADLFDYNTINFPDADYPDATAPTYTGVEDGSWSWAGNQDQEPAPINRGERSMIWVADTGTNAYHQEFRYLASANDPTAPTRLVKNVDCTDFNRGCYEMNPSDANYIPENGHGTHCAGIAAGLYRGVAPDALIGSLKVFGHNDFTTDPIIISAVQYALANKVTGRFNVLSMSLGGPKNEPVDELGEACKAAWKAGLTIVVAAGNDGDDVGFESSCKSSPAYASQPIDDRAIITVGASDQADARVDFSAYGNCTTIFAPGKMINSAWIVDDDHPDAATAYNTISGTSMATPQVAGALALYGTKSPNATPNSARTALYRYATKDLIYPYNPTYTYYNQFVYAQFRCVPENNMCAPYTPGLVPAEV